MRLAQLIDAARAAPGKLNFGAAGHATGPHLIAESIAAESGDMYVRAINGTLDFISTTPVVLTTGRGMKGLAIIGEARLPGHPEVPLLKELGYKRGSFPGLMVLGMYAPKGMPATASTFLRGACPKALDTPLAKAAGDKTSTPLAYADGPVYGESLRQDYGNVGELLRTLGVKTQ